MRPLEIPGRDAGCRSALRPITPRLEPRLKTYRYQMERPSARRKAREGGSMPVLYPSRRYDPVPAEGLRTRSSIVASKLRAGTVSTECKDIFHEYHPRGSGVVMPGGQRRDHSTHAASASSGTLLRCARAMGLSQARPQESATVRKSNKGNTTAQRWKAQVESHHNG